jgi:hypothetical protein
MNWRKILVREIRNLSHAASAGSASMNRVWDYIGFAIWFAGLGYIALWAFGSPEQLLSPGLHAAGMAAAMSVPVRLLVSAVSRRRIVAKNMPRPRNPAAVLQPPRRKPARSYRAVKPRNHFGLRDRPE